MTPSSRKAKGQRFEREVAKNWLRGIADGEGYVSKINTESGSHCSRCITISNTDTDIINEIERCLNVLGIEFRTKKRVMINKKDIYVVILSNQTNLIKWYKDVGFVSKKKMNRLKMMIEDYQGKRLVHNPYKQKLVEECMKKGMSRSEISKISGFSTNTIKRFILKSELKAYL